LAQAQNLLQSSRASVLALTLGAKGAALLTRHGQVFQARELEPLKVVDTVGAGDCFLAGLVTAMLGHRLPADWGSAAVPAAVAKDLLGSAIASASWCVMQRGCVPPSRSQVLQRMAAVGLSFAA
jgi:fructokinase